MKFKTNTKSKGFSLIEVMIALVVLAIGILGISKLQGTLIRNSSDAHQRTVAVSIAQQKIDDLRSYSKLNSDLSWAAALAEVSPETEMAYEHITGNTNLETYTETGGLILPTSSRIVGTTSYSLNWTVENYWYEDADGNDATLLTHTSTIPTPAPARSDFKLLTVVVAWDDVEGTSQSISLDTVIDAYSLINTAFSASVHNGGDSPIIPYTPLQAPDVVPVTLDSDGLKKETSKPIPDVSKKGYSTVVTFETVTYNTNLDTVKREEFRTVACRCGSGSTISSHLYGQTEWDEQNVKLTDNTYDDFTSVSNTSVNNGGGETQAAECTTCCADGPDVAGTVFKACRLKRIDGILRYFPPWKMVAFSIIPASFFDANGIPTMTAVVAGANISTYSDHVEALVRAGAALSEAGFNASSAIDTSFAPAGFTSLDHLIFTAGNGNDRPIQLRVVYMDYPPSGIYDDCSPCTAATVPLDRIPFYEVNLTQLVGWTPDRNNTTLFTSDFAHYDYVSQHDNVGNSPGCNPATAPNTRTYITNDTLENGCELSHSRGEFFPRVADVDATSPTTVQTIIYTSNDGIVDQIINIEPTITSTIDITTQ
ncbi:MAG: prepilin-type N-terminal cleavage/methylation domain-containing protein [Piscirickettsiaceae bacterium]|nr:prepilin-type N-terminal cleavage/methylation domain-containing protein [Piscirickettsiaceae bacterium]